MRSQMRLPLRSPLRVATLQFFATPFNLARNLDTAERLARAAATQGARLIVLPACFNTGYVFTPRLSAAMETDKGATTQWLKHLSAELNVLIGGALLRRVGDHIFNTFVLVEPNGQTHAYPQQHPFLWEKCYFEAGHERLIATTEWGRIGLLIGWDAARHSVIKAYRGQVDMMLMASALPRFHRAVLNFPLGKKVYLAQLTPGLLRHREVIDDWYTGGVATNAALIGAPLVHSAMAGRFVTELPRPRLSLGLMALSQPRYWPLALAPEQASLRATFSGASAIVNARGEILASIESEEGLALAEIVPGPTTDPPTMPDQPYLWPHLPLQWLALDWWLKR